MRIPKLWRAIRDKRSQPVPSKGDGETTQILEEAGTYRWRVAGASVTGLSHQKADQPCDDAWFAAQAPNGLLVAVVSDGAGSARMGGFAARAICDAFKKLLASLSAFDFGTESVDDETTEGEQAATQWHDILPRINDCLTAVRSELIEHAATNAGEPDDYLATVVSVIAHPAKGVLCLHIGDGAITIFRDDDKELLTSQPDNGEYLNQTYFLVEDEWKLHCRVVDHPSERIGSIFLMTDGVTELAYHRRGRILTPESKFFVPLAEFLMTRTPESGQAGIARILDAERARQLVDDDKTLVWIKPA